MASGGLQQTDDDKDLIDISRFLNLVTVKFGPPMRPIIEIIK